MRIIFDGAETPRWRSLLQDLGVQAVAAGADALKRGAGSVAYPGETWMNGGTVSEPVDDGCESWALLAEQARPDRVIEYAGTDRVDHRHRYDASGFVPLWLADEDSFEDLRAWSQQFGAIALRRGHAARPEVRPVLRELMGHGIEVVVLAAGLAELNEAEWSTALTTVWTVPQRFGDAILPAQGRAHRTPQDQVVHDTIDPEILARAAVDEHWLADGPARCRVAVATLLGLDSAPSTSEDSAVVTDPGAELTPRVRQTLPLVVNRAANPRTLLSCDRCHLASVCPEVSPGSECAYEIPARLDGPDDTAAMMQTLIGVQSQRAMLAAMGERFRGGELNPNVGAEIDRTFKLMERARKITEQRDYTELTVRQSTGSGGDGGGGILGQLFGNAMGQEMKQFDQPIDASTAVERASS